MGKSYGQDNPEIIEYVWSLLEPEDTVLRAVREECERASLPQIQVGGMDGRHLEILALAISAKKIVEIGTLGGYSGISLLRGMGPGGRLFTFERDLHHAEVAKKNFARAGFSEQMQIFVGPAMEELPKIEVQGPFDMVFIDANKVGYPEYLQWATANLRKGGMVVGDNTFASGQIHGPSGINKDRQQVVEALQKFNHTIAKSGAYRATILPTGEGLTVGIRI